MTKHSLYQFTTLMAFLIIGTITLATCVRVTPVRSEEAEEVGHRCSGLWTGNSCIGTWQRTDKWDSYSGGDTYIHDGGGKVQQRPERRR